MRVYGLFKVFAMVGTLAVLCGCGDSGGSDNPVGMPDPDPMPEPDPEPEPEPDHFSTFVIEQFQMTSDTADPVPVDNRDFAFDTAEDPEAFDELLDENP